MESTKFPPLILSAWEESRNRIHKYCRLVGAIREVLSEPLSKALHTNLLLCRKGITTSTLRRDDGPAGQSFEVIIEMNRARLCIESNYREPLHIALTGQSLNALCDETCSLLTDIGVRPPLERPSFLEGTRGKFNKDHVKAYWKALKSTNGILKKIEFQLPGESGPIQMRVDNLTLSLTWSCKDLFPEGSVEEIDCGFSTGDEIFTDTHFFVQSFPDKQALGLFLTGGLSDLVVVNSSKLILPYLKVSNSDSGNTLLYSFFYSVISSIVSRASSS